MRKKYLLTIACGLLLAFCFGNTAVAEGKVGYINLQRLVNESNMGKAAKQEIVKLRKAKEKAAVNKLNEVNRLKKEVETKGAKMALNKKQEVIESLQKAYKEYQRLLADAREDITREDRQLVAIILKKADGVLKAVAKRKKYTIILKDPKAVGYLDPKVDITNAVLKALNKKK
jgi:outer membrane protein